MKQPIFSVFLTLLLFSSIAARAADPVDPASMPLHITSDAMTSDQSAGTVEFTGNVVATRDDGVIHADALKVFFTQTSNDSSTRQTVARIEATGHVIYEAEDRKAFSDRAVYTVDNQVLVLTGGAPRVVTGSSFVTGQTITLYRTTGQVLVESGSTQRVEALFNPEELKKKSGD